MDIANPLAAVVDPVFRKLKLHDISRVEVNVDMIAVEAVDKRVHFLRAEEESIRKNILHVQRDAGFLSRWQHRFDRLGGSFQTDIVWYRLGLRVPGDVNGSGYHQQIICSNAFAAPTIFPASSVPVARRSGSLLVSG